MAKRTIQLNVLYDFLLIGIVSSAKDYRISSLLNKTVTLKLSKQEDLALIQESLEIKNAHYDELKKGNFSKYCYNDQLSRVDYYLVANKNTGEYLIPEMSKIDYFLIIKSNSNSLKESDILQKIKSINIIQTAFTVDIHQLKSKQNLIIE